MKLANIIEIKVFSHEGEFNEEVKKGLLDLVGLDIDKEKIKLSESVAKGRHEGEEDITIFEVILEKQRHTNQFLKHFIENLGEQKKTVLEQIDSRLDEEMNFFIRLDKEKMTVGEYKLTDSGNCYHTRINVAAFPHKREVAKEVIKEMFNIS